MTDKKQSTELAEIKPSTEILDITISPERIEQRLKLKHDQKKTFIKFVRKAMKKEVHWRKYTSNGKPQLLQDGAMLMMDFYGVEDDYETQKETFTDDFYAVTIKSILSHPNGRRYIGLGWANSKENNFQTRINKEGLGTMINTIGQMARKRALVNAVRHLPFVCELFTDDSGQDNDKPVRNNSKPPAEKLYTERIKKVFGYHFSLYDTRNEAKIKEKIASLMGLSDVPSLREFVRDEELWEKYEIVISEIAAERSHQEAE